MSPESENDPLNLDVYVNSNLVDTSKSESLMD